MDESGGDSGVRSRRMVSPYFLWVSYATALNFAIWRANPAS
jgi:tryptophan-rich sensory protein